MPPPGLPRPDKPTYDGLVSWLESELDRSAGGEPEPGGREFPPPESNRVHNIVRDLLALDIDFSDLLPIDDSGRRNGELLTTSPRRFD